MKYQFEIVYQTQQIRKVSDTMKLLDLGDKEFAWKEKFVFEGRDVSIDYLKEVLSKIFIECDLKILSIEGGKIE